MSVKANAASTAKPAELDVSKLIVEQTSSPKELMDPSKLIFGHNFTGTCSTSFRLMLELDPCCIRR